MMRQKKIFGLSKLLMQTREAIEAELSEIDELLVGDSEIERVLYASILMQIFYGRRDFTDISVVRPDTNIDLLFEEHPGYGVYRSQRLILEPQAHIEDWRVDFVLYAWTEGRIYTGGAPKWIETEAHWRRLVIECDGHDFHERTKEQAARDRSRDRGLSARGYDVSRFTGSEIWQDPWGCADQIMDWAERGV